MVSIPKPSENGDEPALPPPPPHPAALLVVVLEEPLSGHPWEAGFPLFVLWGNRTTRPSQSPCFLLGNPPPSSVPSVHPIIFAGTSEVQTQTYFSHLAPGVRGAKTVDLFHNTVVVGAKVCPLEVLKVLEPAWEQLEWR